MELMLQAHEIPPHLAEYFEPVLTPALPAKNLVGIPWRFALAMQAAGWWLRGDYIWSKPNPMPESVTDRCTRSHEYIFHFSKAPTYYWDADAIREPHARLWDANNGGSWAHIGDQPPESKAGNHSGAYPLPNPAGRNARSVWEIATESFSGAHFATFPRALVRRAIRAGSSERGACAACGAPWKRVTQRVGGDTETTGRPKAAGQDGYGSPTSTLSLSGNGSKEWAERGSKRVEQGWAPTCTCDCPETRPCVVLDPFAGSGTTLAVARQLGRIGWGAELQPDYVTMSVNRLRQHVLL